MRYMMKQKLFSFGNDFTIQDEQGHDRYFVDGKAFSIGDKFSFQDMRGNELVSVEQKLFSFGKCYRIFEKGRQVATVKKQPFTFFRDVFDVEDADAGDLDASGDFLDHEYRFTRDGRPIAYVSKTYFSWTDTYGVEIVEGEDDVLILACTVVIDMCSHDKD